MAAIYERLKLLCGNDVGKCNELLKLLLHALQHPNEPSNVAVCLVGTHRCSKAALWALVNRLVGNSVCSHLDPSNLRGSTLKNAARGSTFVRITEGEDSTICRVLGQVRALIANPALERTRSLYRSEATISIPHRLRFLIETKMDVAALPPMIRDGHFLVLNCLEVGDTDYRAQYYAALNEGSRDLFINKFKRMAALLLHWDCVRLLLIGCKDPTCKLSWLPHELVRGPCLNALLQLYVGDPHLVG